MVRQSQGRPGFTLTEVLMAMFVMAIGMISLLALFPAAFQQAKWALDNEQVARAAANAQSTTELPHMPVTHVSAGPLSIPLIGITMQNVRNDDRYRPDANNPYSIWRTPYAFNSMLGRTFFLVDTTTNTWTYNTNLSSAFVGTKVKFPPVFVDPAIADNYADDPSVPLPLLPSGKNGTLLPLHVGSSIPALIPFSNVTGSWPANDPALLRPKVSLGIPRSSMSQYSRDVDTSSLSSRIGLNLRRQSETSMGDEINFGVNGQPTDGNGRQYPDALATPYPRQRRFSWAYLCNWPDYNNPEICEVTAVLFNSRPDGGGASNMPPGEVTYGGNAAASNAAGTDTTVLGRVFVKGLTQATIFLGTTSQPMNLKSGEWILDSTLILPEYNDAFPNEKAPFLDTIDTTPGMTAYVYNFPVGGPFTRTLRPGLVGGHFYKVLDVSEVRAAGGGFFQTITLDRPAKSDGFSATILSGVADVITKSVGRMPQR